MPRINAELADDAGQHDEFGFTGVNLFFGADDVDVDRVGHECAPLVRVRLPFRVFFFRNSKWESDPNFYCSVFAFSNASSIGPTM